MIIIQLIKHNTNDNNNDNTNNDNNKHNDNTNDNNEMIIVNNIPIKHNVIK